MFKGKYMPFVTLKLSPISLIPSSSISKTAAAGLPLSSACSLLRDQEMDFYFIP